MNAWPSIRSALHKGCVLRLSNGYTNRANSANPLYTDKNDFADLIGYAERFYESNAQPCVFKILQTGRHEELDALLERKAYEKITPTTVMKCDLKNFSDYDADDITIHRGFAADWFEPFIAINEIKEAHVQTARKMLDLVSVDAIVASVRIDGEIVACGYGAMESGHVGFFDIVVKREKRGRGMGRTLMNGIIREAKRRGASSGYLQAMDNNEIAKNLYASLGFKSDYKYWYRKK